MEKIRVINNIKEKSEEHIKREVTKKIQKIINQCGTINWNIR